MKKLLAAAALVAATAAHAQWVYDSYPDEMDGGVIHRAGVSSSNTIEQAPPYDGLTKGHLFVRKWRSGMDVMYAVTQGQLVCSPGCKVIAKFDDGPPVSFRAQAANDGSSTMVYIVDAKGFVKRAKAANTIRMQAVMYRSGVPVMRFNTSPALKDLGK